MPRPKGYAGWAPTPAVRAVLDDVQDVLREYRPYLPLTVRQIFYRLVGQYGYDKTERAYSRLCEYLVRARRAQMIDFVAIRDDGTTHNNYAWYDSPSAFWQETEKRAANYSRDMLTGQPVYVELWCEAAGMVPQLERVANQYSVPVYSTGGFSSVTVTYEIAERALGRDRPTVFLHVGDYDPSGESIFEAMTEDARQFLYNRLLWRLQDGGPDDKAVLDACWPSGKLYPQDTLPGHLPDLQPTRVALTGDQVERYGLPTAPPKASDTRSARWVGETCQAEAMPPDLLATVVQDAIEGVLDLDLVAEVDEAEKVERADIVAAAKGMQT
jgi:hypothetical protein